MQKKLIAVLGPTASGKTALSVELAKRLDGEIVSCDSMQIYRGMDIGTAKPTDEEKRGIPHHMIDVADPTNDFSCADYAAMAKPITDDILARGKQPIICGGTGLYLNALIMHPEMSDEGRNDDVRASLSSFAEKHSAEALHNRLAAVDPESAEAIHPANVRRVIRALEIYETTGITKSEWDRRSRETPPEYGLTSFVLDYLNRDILYSRIDRRVDIMLENGLEAEARALYTTGKLGRNTSAAQAIGYKEFGEYFAGEITLEEVAGKIKQATRRYAKRQITWFKRDTAAIKLHPDENAPEIKTTAELADEAMNCLE